MLVPWLKLAFCLHNFLNSTIVILKPGRKKNGKEEGLEDWEEGQTEVSVKLQHEQCYSMLWFTTDRARMRKAPKALTSLALTGGNSAGAEKSTERNGVTWSDSMFWDYALCRALSHGPRLGCATPCWEWESCKGGGDEQGILNASLSPFWGNGACQVQAAEAQLAMEVGAHRGRGRYTGLSVGVGRWWRDHEEGTAGYKEALLYEMNLANESSTAYSSLVYLQFEPDKCFCTTSCTYSCHHSPHHHEAGHSRNTCPPLLTPFLLSFLFPHRHDRTLSSQHCFLPFSLFCVFISKYSK